MNLPSQTQPRPRAWRPLKYFCAEHSQYGLNVSSSEYTDHKSGGWRLLRTTDINEDGSLTLGNEVYINPEGVSSKYRLIAGDLLLSRSGTLGRSFLCTTSSPPSTFAGYLIRFRPISNVDPRYLYYCSRTTFFEDGIRANAVASTIANFNAERYGGLQLPWCTLPEQRAIADYLDTETDRIDTLISKKRRLIELLAEYRTALITHTVTRGLDPSPRLRPSGVDWLGDIPTHWEVRRLRHTCEFAYGDSLPSASRQPGKVPVFGSNGVIGCHDEPNTLAPVIVIGRKGSHGEVNFSDASVFAIDTTYFVDERYTSADLRWLYFALPCTELADESLDSAVPGLSREHAYGKCLPVPPVSEQRAVADYLDTETANIDGLSSRVKSVIKLLQEYRTALITAAVTGEISGVA